MGHHGWQQQKILVPTQETPQPWVVAPRRPEWGQHGGESTRPAHLRREPPQRVAPARLAAEPANEPELEARTKTDQRLATKRSAQKNACPGPVDAEQPRRSPSAKRLAAADPRAASPALERLHTAQERPSCRGHPNTPLEPARGTGKEAAFGECSPRPSAGRPRKASR